MLLYGLEFRRLPKFPRYKSMALTVYVDGQMQQFTGITAALGDALVRGKAVRPDGSYYTVTSFLGGFLLDGCPLNIIFNQGWLPGQIDALKSGGILPTCLVPGTLDYYQFYGQTGVPAPTTTPATQLVTQPQPAPPPVGIPPGSAPPTIQVTESPYVPPIATGDVTGGAAPPATGPFGMDWTTLILIGVAVWFLMKQSKG
jgi:hypothetical protein